MGALQTLAAGRRAAERLMLDRCTVVRLGEPVTVNGNVTTPETPVYGTVAAPARCRLQTYEAQESNPEAGGATFTVQRYALHVPIGSFDPKIGDVVQIRTAIADPSLVGRRYRVVALLHKTLATAQRLGVEEIP